MRFEKLYLRIKPGNTFAFHHQILEQEIKELDEMIGPKKIVEIQKTQEEIKLNTPENHKVVIVIGWKVEDSGDLESLLNNSLNPLTKTASNKKPKFDLKENFKNRKNKGDDITFNQYVHKFDVPVD